MVPHCPFETFASDIPSKLLLLTVGGYREASVGLIKLVFLPRHTLQTGIIDSWWVSRVSDGLIKLVFLPRHTLQTEIIDSWWVQGASAGIKQAFQTGLPSIKLCFAVIQ